MGANDLPPPGTMLPLDIMALGFEATELSRLNTIFEHAPKGGRHYALAQPSGHFAVLLVNYDNPKAVLDKDALLANAPGTPVVAVSRGALSIPPAYHLRGMLIAARVLAMLDKIPLPVPPPSAPLPSAPPTIAEKPVLESSQQEAQRQPLFVTAPAPARLDGYRALVVDDSMAIQKSLEINLSSLEQITGVDFADNGEMALEKARAVHYDLIFLDVMMPGIDGYETCTQLRKMPAYKKTPIIMVSGKTSPLDEVKGVISGCTTYLTKPVQQEAFQKLSRRVLAWLENYHASGKTSH